MQQNLSDNYEVMEPQRRKTTCDNKLSEESNIYEDPIPHIQAANVASSSTVDNVSTSVVPPRRDVITDENNSTPRKSINRLHVLITVISFLAAIAAIIIAVFPLMANDSMLKEIQEPIKRYDELSVVQIAQSCKELRNQGYNKSGVYTIAPMESKSAIKTYCDMTSDGGGWTLVASVHENNIDGKCTFGDKWSSEQGNQPNLNRVIGNWENFNTFGEVEAVTIQDYKNSAYFDLEASDVLIWHVPNNVRIRDIDETAFLKYHTTDGFLSRYGSTLQSFYAKHTMEISPHKGYSAQILNQVKLEASLIPNWYNYVYDNGLNASFIRDGGNDMYDGGNNVYFKVNNQSYTQIQYGSTYDNNGYEVTSTAIHPFTMLAWIGGVDVNTFSIKVTSNIGADGGGYNVTYQGNSRYKNFFSHYRAFHVYSANVPSICEVYFYISNQQVWHSVTPEVDYPQWTNGTNILEHEIRFTGGQNILAGYLLLSKSYGKKITEAEINKVITIMLANAGHSAQILNEVKLLQNNMTSLIPNWYNYRYDRGLDGSYISDGGSDMYDGGNNVYFKVNNQSYTQIQYGSTYHNNGYEVTSAAIHPFTMLAWIGGVDVNTFSIKVTSYAGADGGGYNVTYQGNLTYKNFFSHYRAFHVYGAYDPSICEVYFYISNQQVWHSVTPEVDYPQWTNGTNRLEHEIRFTGGQNILAGYLLLSKSYGKKIKEAEINKVITMVLANAGHSVQILNQVKLLQNNMTSLIPNWYNYRYDRGLDGSYITDGGSDMYDGGNDVYFKVNDQSYTRIQYGSSYHNNGYEVTSAAIHPFTMLAWIGGVDVNTFSIKVTSDAGADGGGYNVTYQGNSRYKNFFSHYRAFHVYSANVPSICEVYFYISNQQVWHSVTPEVDYPQWTNGTNILEHEIRFTGGQNILAGYLLLSKSNGKQITETEIKSVITKMLTITDKVHFPDRNVTAFPITFAKRSNWPTRSNDVTMGFLQLRARDFAGFPYAMCPGVRLNKQTDPALWCIGGINSNRYSKINQNCGDFAGWNRNGRKSSNDVNSSILIFTRNT